MSDEGSVTTRTTDRQRAAVDIRDRSFPLPGMERIVSSTDVEARPWRLFPGQEGVRDKVLWEDPTSGSYSGMMEVAPGAHVRRHFHPTAAHHLFVVGGTCELSVSERVLGPGSYVYVPVGILHGIDMAGPEGCSLFFLHVEEERSS